MPKDWVREMPEVEDQPGEDVVRKAQRITREVLWVAQRSRPDVAYSVSLMGSGITKVPSPVYKIGIRVIEFLLSTVDQKLSLTPVSDATPAVTIYTDSSFAPFGGKSVSGIFIQYRGKNVVWKGQRQTIVCLSTAEAELVAAVEGVVLGQSIEALITVTEVRQDLGVKRLLVDNLAAIVLAEGGGSTRTRHLRVRSRFIKDMIARKELVAEHFPGDVQLADILTKILPGPRHRALSRLLGLGQSLHAAQVSAEVRQVEPARLQGLSVWLLVLLLVLQAQRGASAEEEGVDEVISPELSLIALMMTLSVLFIWEAGKFCLRSCFSREVHQVRSVRPDNESATERRSKRQEAVRRAIASETSGLRHRYGTSTEEEPEPRPTNQGRPPPPPPVTPSAEYQSRSGLDQPSSSTHLAGVTVPSSQPGFGFADVAPPPPRVQVESRSNNQRREIGVQTEEPRGMTYDELHRLQVLTSTSRTPGVVHLFPGCQALRGVSTNQRHFCRYCLQVARTGI